MYERVFFVNLQTDISQLHYRLTFLQIVFRDIKYLLRFYHLQMTTCRSCIKSLKNTCEIVSYCNWWLKFKFFKACTWNKKLCRRGVLKNSNFSDEHKEQSSRGVLSKNVLKNFVKFTEKNLCRSLLFNKVAGWKP